MKKILLIIFTIIIFYIISIFMFPNISNYIWEKFWLIKFNEKVILFKHKLDNFILNTDIDWKIIQTKDKAVNIKQNIDTNIDNFRDNLTDKTNKMRDSKDDITNNIETLIDTKDNIINTLDNLTWTWR